MNIYHLLYQQIQVARHGAGLTFAAIADTLHRPRSRLSEFMSSLEQAKPQRDRLTTLVEVCETLDVVPLLVPRQRVADIQSLLQPPSTPLPASTARRVFDDVFIDLSDPQT